MAIVTTSQNLTAVSYVAGETIEIRNGAMPFVEYASQARKVPTWPDGYICVGIIWIK
jgi:hypothetical protein